MKVALINTVKETGSTGRIVKALYEKTEQEAGEACIIYGRGKNDPAVKSYRVGTTADFFFHVLRNFFRGESGFGSKKATEKMIDFLEQEKPDIIHLHNIHGFYLQCELLFDYIKKKIFRLSGPCTTVGRLQGIALTSIMQAAGNGKRAV
jgi:hypothetical protein